MDGTPGAGAPSPNPTSIVATPELQQAFSALAQMYESMNGSTSNERKGATDATIQRLENDQNRTQVALTAIQETMVAMQRNLTICMASNRDLQKTVNTQATRINNLEKFVVGLREEHGQLVQHVGAVSHRIAQFEKDTVSAHHQLSDRITHQFRQVAAQIETFQNRIVGPLFSAMQQVLGGGAISSRPAMLQGDNPATRSSGPPLSANAAHQESSQNATPTSGMIDSSVRVASRSSSHDSNTPLAQVVMARSEGKRLPPPPQQVSDAEALAADSATAISPRCPQQESQRPDTDRLMSAPPPTTFSQRSAAEDSPLKVREAPSTQIRAATAPVRILPLPSPSPSVSPSSNHISTSATPQTCRTLPFSPNQSSRREASSETTHDEAMGADVAETLTKRKRAPSVEFVGVQLSKNGADDSRFKKASRTTAMELKGGVIASDSSSTAAAIASPSFKSAASSIHRAQMRATTQDPRRVPPHSSVPMKEAIQGTQQTGTQQAPGTNVERAIPQTNTKEQPSLPSSSTSTCPPIKLNQVPASADASNAAPSNATPAPRDRDQRLSTNSSLALELWSKLAAMGKAQMPSVPTTAMTGPSHMDTESMRAMGGPLQVSQKSDEQSPPTLNKVKPGPSETGPSPETSSSLFSASSETAKHGPARGTQGQDGIIADAILDGASDSQQPVRQAQLQQQNHHHHHHHQQQQQQQQPSKLVHPLPEKPTSQKYKMAAIVSKETTADVPKTAISVPQPSEQDLRSSQPRSEDFVGVSRKSLEDHRSEPGELTARSSNSKIPYRSPDQSRVEWLDKLRTPPPRGGHDDPFFIWAWLGHDEDWSGDICDTTPVLIAPDEVVTESLISECLARDLIRGGRARIADSRSTTQWLELSLSWLHDKTCIASGAAERFKVIHTHFLIVPSAYMRRGVSLGKKALHRLNLETRKVRGIAKPILGVPGNNEPYTTLKAPNSNVRCLSSPKRFARLCELADTAYEMIDTRMKVQRRKPGNQVRTPSPLRMLLRSSLVPRLSRTSAEPNDSAATPKPPATSLQARIEGTCGSCPSQSSTGDAQAAPEARPRRLQRASTPHPCAMSRAEEARMLRQGWEEDRRNAQSSTSDGSQKGTVSDRFDAMLDSGSPLTETGSPAFEAPDEEEVDELADE